MNLQPNKKEVRPYKITENTKKSPYELRLEQQKKEYEEWLNSIDLDSIGGKDENGKYVWQEGYGEKQSGTEDCCLCRYCKYRKRG